MNLRSLFSWLIGFSAILYIPIAGSLKFVDIIVIISAPFLLRKTILNRKSTFVIFLLAFITICSTFFNTIERGYPWDNSFVAIIGLIVSVIAFYSAMSLSLKEVIVFMKGYMTSTVIIIFFSLMAYFNILPIDRLLYHSTGGSFINGTVVDPNRYGYTLNVALAMLLYMNVILGKKYKFKIIQLSLIILVLFAISLTGSRSSMIIALVIILISRIIKSLADGNLFIFRVLFSLTVIIISLFITWIVFENMGVNFYIIDKFQAKSLDYTEDSRFYLLTQLLNLWQESKIIGVGLDGFKILMGLTSHNSFGEILVTSGLMGFVLYLYLVFRNLFLLKKSKNRLSSSQLIVKRISILFFTLSLIYMLSLNLNFLLVFYLLFGLFSEFKRHLYSRNSPKEVLGIKNNQRV